MTDIKAEFEAVPGVDPNAPLLEVTDLHVEFRTQYGVAKAVNGANFRLAPRETLAILGESGCGKSVTAQAIMGILDSPPGFITRGEVRYRGVDVLKLPENERRRVRANQIAMIFQDALSALNPVFTVGFQLGELFRMHRGMSRADAKKRSIELLDQVKIPAAASRVNDFPHQFSGGMRQRVMIAMALALDPEVLIADEPTTALDVTVQAQIMGLLAELQQQRNMGLILITHDMGVVADVADRISVMYAGKVVEEAPVYDIYSRPAHPYAKALLESIPRLDMKGQQLSVIKGLPPALTNIPPGCPFNPRCGYARDVCRQDPPPPPYTVAADRTARCHFWEEVVSS
ncbi:ABC transporter ATP-binding protein [Spirilliplanes yamanashiensis]|uniref:ABC transporter ATP-binding protein n=1 Tax=Spirilliplanes yamanashiensis TaxID=42233 RepID=A0A8J3YAF1_9ACTN|nr:ABC transporter ATP-binding protein [Spirilliplanes yamanashiensis]MDP9815975.1 oligopeptide transport system ATP-binding protein [Spirilliplanes yamanashiensis]GIJ04232.1 ABC transporter ATP-binding protein [Spirilliplanes yamanashiensis]